MNSMYGLERENAELKKLREYQTSIIIDLNSENKALKESRDELLSALRVAAQEDDGYVFNDTIKRAKSIKDKESNHP